MMLLRFVRFMEIRQTGISAANSANCFYNFSVLSPNKLVCLPLKLTILVYQRDDNVTGMNYECSAVLL